jgi:hypothetical protein
MYATPKAGIIGVPSSGTLDYPDLEKGAFSATGRRALF